MRVTGCLIVFILGYNLVISLL